MTPAVALTGAATVGERFDVTTPMGLVTVTFPNDEELPPAYAGDVAAIGYLHAVLSDCVGATGATLSPNTLTPLALVELVPSEDDGIKVAAPSDFSESEPAMSILDSAARRVIQFPRALLDAAMPAKSVDDLRRELSATGASVMERLGLARALLSRFTAPNPDAGNDDEGELKPRASTAHFYDYDDNRKPSQRKRENAAAMEILTRIDTGELDAAKLTDTDRAVLARYSGKGGGLTDLAGKKGSAYEYYTPKPIAEGVWNLLAELGFTGGKVLDPSAGTGIFGATAPQSAVVDAVELNETSGRINALVNGGPGYKAVVSPFEKVAASTPDESYDAIVTNVPFGDKTARGNNYKHDERYQDEPLQNYFILRSLEKLRPGGLAAFITPTSCVSGKDARSADMRIRASYMAEFLGAYRLPNAVFDTAAADVTTDVIVFRKYSREALEKIEELRQQSPQTLIDANVQWQEFISGKYFLGEGKRFVLGEYETGMGKWGEVERVVTKQPTGELAKMLRKFPDSRVNWELLDAAETDLIAYKEGDTITQAGQTLEYRNGQWHPLAKLDMAGTAGIVSGEDMLDPFAAYQARVTYAQMSDYLQFKAQMSENLSVPSWVFAANRSLDKLRSESERAKWWAAGLVGMSVTQVLEDRLSMESGVNFLEEYPGLSESMQTYAKVAKSAPSALTGALGEGLKAIGVHFRRGQYSEVWRGDVNQELAAITDNKAFAYEGLRYESRSVWVDADRAKEVLGDDFDPISSPDWCVSADGKRVAKADDFYVGNVKEVLEQLDRDIEAAASEEIRGKLLWMKANAESRYHVIDVADISFNWLSPFATMQEKLEFARRYIHESAYIDTNADGEESIKLDLPASQTKDDHGKLLMRLSDYLARGTVSLGSAKIAMPEADAMKELRRMIATANQQFDGWCRGNPKIIERLETVAKDPSKLRFRAADDESKLDVPGLHPWWAGKIHGYQSSFVRKMAREFSGVNGFDVGLGKTATALASVQYAQAMGVKNKTAFVVPNSVLSNWRKEAVTGNAKSGAKPVYADGSDCLFIGLRAKQGRRIIDLETADPNDPTIEFTVDSKYYDEDLQRVLTNKHRKVFMSMEAWERIKLRESTAEGFMGYMQKNDRFFAQAESGVDKDEQKTKAKTQSLLDTLTEKGGVAPYLEDMGFDSLVIDEAHNYKNSVRAYEFKSAKYLSLPPPARRGLDMQAKAWFIRGASPLRDGVLALTATPITNSPIEIYSMLALSAGHDRVNDMCAGVQGTDDFLSAMAEIESIDDDGVDGETRNFTMFTGLNNVNLLRKAIGDVMTIRDAEDVGKVVVLPEAEEKASPVSLTPELFGRLKKYVHTYQTIKFGPEKATAEQKKDTQEILEHFQIEGHDTKAIGVFANAFNLINNMEMLILDPELDERASFYYYSPADAGKMAKVIDEFNAKKLTEVRSRKGPHTEDGSILKTKEIKDSATGLVSFEFTIQAVAYLQGAQNRVLIDTMEPSIQDKFEEIAAKHGVELDVALSPKLSAMVENFQHEMANPRGADDDGNPSPIVKQIIFCDRLALHNKIKLILQKRCGIPASKIAIITGQRNNEVDQILAVQDGFNAHGDDNQYQVIIANKKAEVGINLQRGTQAIHHLSIGWTPDSLTQRNGRGVRQGNKTARVGVYYYDAEGTFDSYRRKTVNKKSEWIEGVLDDDGENSVNVNGGVSDAMYQKMIEAQGNREKLANLEREAELEEIKARTQRNRDNQLINAQNVIVAKKKLAEMQSVESFVKEKMVLMYGIWKKAALARKRLNSDKIKDAEARKAKATIEKAELEMAGLRRDIEASVDTIRPRWGGHGGYSLDECFNYAINARKSQDGRSHLEQEQAQVREMQVTVIPDSVLQNEWQYEIDMAKSEVKQYSEAFARQAKADGAMPQAIMDAITAGAGWMWGGRLFVTGCFARKGEGGALMVFKTPNAAAIAYPNGNLHTFTEFASDSDRIVGLKSAEVILPGEPGYDDCITQAAALEDAAVTAGAEEKPFSDAVPEVSLRRKVIGSASYPVTAYRLPAPHFPFPLRFGTTPVSAAIFEAQKAVVRGFGSYPEKVKVAENVAMVNERWSERDKIEAMIDYAIAHGLRMEYSDIGYSANNLVPRFEAMGLDAEFRAVLASAQTEDGMYAAIDELVTGKMPWMDFTGSVKPVEVIGYSRNSMVRQRAVELRSAQTAATAQAATVQAAEVRRADAAAESEIVGVGGQTQKWYKTLKAVAGTAGGGRAKWDGTAGVWNVYRSTWNALVAQYPGAANELEIRPATIRRF